MRRKVLKIGAFFIIIALSIWNMELNETKILFTFLLSFDSLAKTETACLGECSHNTGICKKNAEEGTGSSCVVPIEGETKNCYKTVHTSFPESD